jgi:hypothetical protein
MHGLAQERLQIYLRSLDKVKKSNKACNAHPSRPGDLCAMQALQWNFRRRFAMARPLFFERAEARRAKGGLRPAPENSALSLERRV